MAYGFAANKQVSGSFTAHKNQTRLTLACWVRRPATGTIQSFGFTDVGNNTTSFVHYSDNSVYITVRKNDTSYAYKQQPLTGWNHCCFVFDGGLTGSANRLKFYLNGTQQALSFSGAIPATTSDAAGVETLRFGRNQSGNYWSTGDFAEYGLWQEALTGEDVAALGKGITCDKLRPEKLLSYIPLIRDLQDVRSGTSLTNASATVANHPRIYP